MVKKTIVITNNREIYDQFNKLFFSSEIRLDNVKKVQIERILGNINKKNKVLDLISNEDHIIVKKIGILNFNIYLR